MDTGQNGYFHSGRGGIPTRARLHSNYEHDTEFVWKMFIEMTAEVVTLLISTLNTTKSFKFKNR